MKNIINTTASEAWISEREHAYRTQKVSCFQNIHLYVEEVSVLSNSKTVIKTEVETMCAHSGRSN